MSLHATLSPPNIPTEAAARGRTITNSRVLRCPVCGLSTTVGPMARHTCDASYTAVHFRKVRRNGSAKKRLCITCGQRALDWAYQHVSEDEREENGLRYSLNLADYEAMCRGCHLTLDEKHNPAGAAARVAAAKGVPSEVRRRAGLASVGTPAGDRQRHERALAGGRATAKRWGK